MDDSEIETLDSVEGVHWWYKNRRFILEREISFLSQKTNILDLGSAGGGNTLFLKSLGYKVTSVEFSDYAISLQKSKGIPVIKADAKNLPFEHDTFDLVLCLDVLEHITEDDLVIKEIFRVLKPNGNLIISVPQFSSLWSQHDVSVNHVRRYEKQELIKKLVLYSFKIEKTFNAVVFILPLVKILRKFSQGSSLNLPNPFINLLGGVLSYIERNTFIKYFPGLTLFVSASKINK